MRKNKQVLILPGSYGIARIGLGLVAQNKFDNGLNCKKSLRIKTTILYDVCRLVVLKGFILPNIYQRGEKSLSRQARNYIKVGSIKHRIEFIINLLK